MDGLYVVLLQKLQTEALVPASGVHVNADLTANGKLKPSIRKFLPQGFHELDANVMFLWMKIKFPHYFSRQNSAPYKDTRHFPKLCVCVCVRVCACAHIPPISTPLYPHQGWIIHKQLFQRR